MKTYLKRAEGWARDRASEPSTWAGLVSFVATVMGINLDPTNASAIAAAGATVASALLVAFSQGKKNSTADTETK